MPTSSAVGRNGNTVMAEPRNEVEALQLLRRLVDIGCPTYRIHEGSRTRDGRACCIFCDEPIDGSGTHADACLWLLIEKKVQDETGTGTHV